MKILIICSDVDGARRDVLAGAFAGNEVYAKIDGEARLRSPADKWAAVPGPKIPMGFDVLLFHTGNNDPSDIPTSREYRSKFSFSGSASPPDVDGHADAVKIMERIEDLGEEELAGFAEEVAAYLAGNCDSALVPTICRSSEDQPPSPIGPLVACDILLQGYLAVRAPKRIFGPDAESFMRENGILQNGNEEALARTAIDSEQRLFRSGHPGDELKPPADISNPDRNEEGYYWFDECLPDVEQRSWADLLALCEDLKNMTSLGLVWSVLQGECLGEADGCSLAEVEKELLNAGKEPNAGPGSRQDRWTDLFMAAHHEYMSLPLMPFEKIRSVLTHNRIAGMLICKIGNIERGDDRDPDRLKNRFSALFSALSCGCDVEKAESDVDASRVRSVLAAARDWSQTAEEIGELFEVLPSQHGLVLTKEGEACRDALLDRKNGAIVRISSFLERLHEGSDVEANIEELESAVDQLYDILHVRMKHAPGSGKYFGGLLALR